MPHRIQKLLALCLLALAVISCKDKGGANRAVAFGVENGQHYAYVISTGEEIKIEFE